ncbi:hydantoinase B/oxoprolinase family protein [Baekduia soli]|uniref:Hydantoinase B/oxoprolinase family protein n=1 Tax=Baekduia soli TaxID=496014 RepID=A0A5B8TZM0_9ACTN|nr:hydantoinase B/oxoprolinase family protein [Baekduia soli]QEC46172.1 hydantoinase B/oxoprolinase family protein [Baekduia soli]
MATEQITGGTNRYVASAEDIRERFDIDLTTGEVIRHSLINTCSQMAWNLTVSAFSSVVRDLQDFSVGIASPWLPDQDLQLDLLASAEGCAIHFFTFQYKARNNIMEFGLDNLEPGDVLVYNDPFRGGSHVMDIGCARPVFVGDEIIAFTMTDAHWVDIGGPVPGGFSPGYATDMWMEGIRLSPRLLFRGGKKVKSTFDLFLDNTRIPEISLNDLQAKVATLGLGEQAIRRSVEKYGRDTFVNAMRYVLDYGERRMRAAIAELPDGDYLGEDAIDDDGIVDEEHLVKATLRKRGDCIELDLSGSARQSVGNANGQSSDVASGGHIAIKSMILPDVDTNAGLFRPIDMVLPAGSIVHALPPAANTQGHLLPTCKLTTAVQQALANARPDMAVGESYDDIPTIGFGGLDTRGDTPAPFVCFQVPFGPFGGTATHDGLSYSLHIIGNCLELSYEIEEEFYPIVILRKEFVPDTAGAGTFRGGPAMVWEEMPLVDVTASASFEHIRHRTKGVFGGAGGHSAFISLVDPAPGDDAPSTHDGGSQPRGTVISGMVDVATGAIDVEHGEFRTGKWANRSIPARSVIVMQVAGGAGYGSPLERDPVRVQRDVEDELVSIDGAREHYGVVIDPTTLTVDEAATTARRTELKAEA